MIGKVVQNTFAEGLNQDVSKFKYNPQQYFDALNLHLVTEDGLSTGSLENEKGTIQSFKIPSLGPVYHLYAPTKALSVSLTVGGHTASCGIVRTLDQLYQSLLTDSYIQTLIRNGQVKLGVNAEYVSFLSSEPIALSSVDIQVKQVSSDVDDLVIIGHGTLREYFVIFTTNIGNTLAEPTSGPGQIWRFTYDRVNNKIDDNYIDSNGYLKFDGALLYNDDLKFSRHNKVHMEGDYKNETVVKAYFYDGFNYLRHINLANADSYMINPANLEMIPNCNLTTPELNAVLVGGFYKSGMVQYAYQLFTLDGAETVYSPLSGMVHLTSTSDSFSDTREYMGTDFDGVAGKSVRLTASDLDLNFTHIKLFRIYYSGLNTSPLIDVIASVAIPGESRSVSVIDDGYNYLESIPYQKFTSLGGALFVPKDLTVKQNILLASNLREYRFDVDQLLGYEWDARAYRFDARGTTAKLTGVFGGNVGSDFKMDGAEVHSEADCTQDYDSYWTDGMRYDLNGRLGGSGKNISYRFKIKKIAIDEDQTRKNYYAAREGNTINPSYTSYASPYVHSKYGGYARGEVYRFAIVFRDYKGKQSFAKWIADIRMPESQEMNSVSTYTSTTNGTTTQHFNYSFTTVDTTGTTVRTYANILHLEFRVDTSLLKEFVQSYEIIRVHRDEFNQTVVGSGIVTPWINKRQGVNGSEANWHPTDRFRFFYDEYSIPTEHDDEVPAWFPVEVVLGDDEHSGYDSQFSHFGTGSNSGQTTLFSNHEFNFNCPEMSHKIFTGFRPGDFVKLIGVTDRAWAAADVTALSLPVHADQAYGFATRTYKAAKILPTTTIGPVPKLNLVTAKEVRGQEYVDEDHPDMHADINDKDYVHKVKAIYGESNLGWGKTLKVYGQTQAMPTLAAGIDPDTTGIKELYSAILPYASTSNILGVPYGSFETSGIAIGTYYRTIPNQYGGQTYSARSNVTYVPCNAAVDIDTQIITVFGGDVFIDFYEFAFRTYHDKVYQKNDDEGEFRSGIEVVMIPVESSIMLPLVNGSRWTREVDVENKWLMQHRAGGHICSYGVNPQWGNLFDRLITQDYDYYRYNTVYSRTESSQFILPRPYYFDDDTTFDVRIRGSEQKAQSDLDDKWLVFLDDVKIDMNAKFGPVNAITTVNNTVIAFQDKAINAVSVNENALSVVDSTGASLSLGKGGVLDDFITIAENTGTIHQESVINTGSMLYYYDSVNKTINVFTQNMPMALSIGAGIQSWFKKNLIGQINTTDTTLLDIGVTGIYDFSRNRILYTFMDKIASTSLYGTLPSGGSLLTNFTFIPKYVAVGDSVTVTGLSPEEPTQIATITHISPTALEISAELPNNFLGPVQVTLAEKATRYTWGYNELFKRFESRYSFTPNQYLMFDGSLFSVSHLDGSVVHEHGLGEYGTFYGVTYDSEVTLIINPEVEFNKVFTNMFFDTMVSNDTDNDIDETFGSIIWWNDYQTTSTMDIATSDRITRRLKTWKVIIPRNAADNGRLRSHYLFTKFVFPNSANKRLLFDSLLTTYLVNEQ